MIDAYQVSGLAYQGVGQCAYQAQFWDSFDNIPSSTFGVEGVANADWSDDTSVTGVWTEESEGKC